MAFSWPGNDVVCLKEFMSLSVLIPQEMIVNKALNAAFSNQVNGFNIVYYAYLHLIFLENSKCLKM